MGFPYLFKEDGTMKSESELRASMLFTWPETNSHFVQGTSWKSQLTKLQDLTHAFFRVTTSLQSQVAC